MYVRLWVLAGAAGCVAPGAGAPLAARIADAVALGADPAWLCVADEAGAAEASVVERFGWYSLDGGRAVWCDLPGRQADAAGREAFVPLGSSEAWSACGWSPAGGDCEAIAESDVAPARSEVSWECRDGTVVPLGEAVDWTCEASGWGGDASRTLSLRWDSPW